MTVSQAEIDAQRAAIADSFVTRVVLPVAIVVALALVVSGSLLAASRIQERPGLVRGLDTLLF